MAEAGASELECPHCSGVFAVTAEMIGAEVACPHCDRSIRVPGSSSAPPPITQDAPPLRTVPPAPPISEPPFNQSRPPGSIPTPPPTTSAGPPPVAPGAVPPTLVAPGATAIIRPHGKIVKRGDREVELRDRPRGERASRQAIRNFVVLLVCLAILLYVAYSFSKPSQPAIDSPPVDPTASESAAPSS